MKLLNVAVIGRNGQLAKALDNKTVLAGYSIRCYGRDTLDLTSSEPVISEFTESLEVAEVLINAAAYTAVDCAEDDEEVAFQVNAKAPAFLAKACARRGIPFVHISTDYVFDGTNTVPYKIDDPTQPLGVYGASKLAGEKAILDIGGKAAILRTSWVYDGQGQNFLTTMLRLAQDRSKLGVVSDQFGRPTYAGHLADAALRVSEELATGNANAEGLFHVSNTGDVIHWAEFAKSIFEVTQLARQHGITVDEITSAEFPTRARRPSYSALDTSHFEDTFNMKLPDWRAGLKSAIDEWTRSNAGRKHA